jgi:hypothetical protein
LQRFSVVDSPVVHETDGELFDAVKHLVLCRIERRPPRLDMTVYPYLPQAHVAMTSAKTYLSLLTGAAS